MNPHFFLHILLLVAVAFGNGCREKTNPSDLAAAERDEHLPDEGLSQDDPDLVAINEAIHGFYAWYDDFQQDETKRITFTKAKGNHLALDVPKLEQYFSHIKTSGFISDVLIKNEIAALKECEKLWENESLDEPPSCLDYDRFFCAQDWDITWWTQAPIEADGLGTEAATATLSGGEGFAQKFDLRKENGKWLIARIHCD